MPFGTNVTNLVATYSTTGEKVTVNGNPQISGVTENDFTKPIEYMVTTKDGSTSIYEVMVTVAESSAKEIIKYSLKGQSGKLIEGNITDHSILVTMPFGTNVTNLVATYSITGENTTVNGNPQTSGITKNDFTKPLEYLVMAQDGSTTVYKVTVIVSEELFSCINDPVTSNVCGCLAINDGSGLIWYADGSKIDTWASWCSHTGPAADGRCISDAPSLRSFNNANHCGYSDWHLPTLTIPKNDIPVDQIGGNWGALGTFAKNNGWIEGEPFSNWLNNPVSSSNHFTGINTDYYWSSVSLDDNINTWCVTMVTGTEFGGRNTAGVLLVRGGG